MLWEAKVSRSDVIGRNIVLAERVIRLVVLFCEQAALPHNSARHGRSFKSEFYKTLNGHQKKQSCKNEWAFFISNSTKLGRTFKDEIL
jgi:hypothetical protein